MAGWGAVVAPVAMLANGGAQYFGQQQTNRSNETIAKDVSGKNKKESALNRAFQADQARLQMMFQEQMSSSAYQRARADLERAGLNPLLAMPNGASTPSGAAGSGSQASAQGTTVQSPLSAAAASAMEAMQVGQAFKKQEAEIGLMEAQKIKTGTETAVMRKGIPEAELKNDIYDSVRPLVQKMKNAIQSGADRSNRFPKQPTVKIGAPK